jgi:hypothetical protein
MATPNCLFLKNGAIQDQTFDSDVNGFGRSVACGLQNNAGSEPACTPASGEPGNSEYQTVNISATIRIQ